MPSRLGSNQVSWERAPVGYGQSFTVGTTEGRTTYLVVVPGDNEIEAGAGADILTALGSADSITGYPANTEVRPLLRRALSRGFVVLMNFLSGNRLHYDNRPNPYAPDHIRPLSIDSSSLAFSAITVVRLLRRGHTSKEVGLRLRGRSSARTSAVKVSNILAVLFDVARLLVHRS